MYKSVNRISVLKFITNDGLCSKTTHWIQLLRRSSGLKEEKAVPVIQESEEMDFKAFLRQRQEEARRSFVVKFTKTSSSHILLKLFSDFGGVKKAFHFRDSKSHFLLVELNSADQLEEFTKQTFNIPLSGGSYQKFFVLNERNRLFSNKHNNVKDPGVEIIDLPSRSLGNNELFIKANSNLSKTISDCYECSKMNDAEIRKRFLMCRQVEVLCSGLLPDALAHPFGSSVTGFGVNDSDLDVVILKPVNENSLFTGPVISDQLDTVRSHLETISYILKTFSHGCSNFFFVRHAKVPILKFRNNFTKVDCDLSIYNLHGVAMSQILFISASMDWRIRALVIFLKLWAHKSGIVLRSPSATVTNFSLSMLVMFFFQQMKMLPPWNVFPCNDEQFLLPESELVKINSEFRKKISVKNDKTVGELCRLFFEFYSKFDFEEYGISLIEGEAVKHYSDYSLYIENPLKPDVNVSVNVKKAEMSRFRDIITESANILSNDNETQVKKFLNLRCRKQRIVFEEFL